MSDGVESSSLVELPAAPAGGYMENYRILQQASQELRDQEVVDIDKLIPLVDRALTAYGACKARIEAVERLLAERLSASEPSAE